MSRLEFDWQINEYMIYCHSKQLRPKTMQSYESTLRLFEKWCKDEMDIFTVDAVTENIIRRYIAELQYRGKYTFYSDNTKRITNCPDRRRDFNRPLSVVCINNYLRNLSAFFGWLTRSYTIAENPMRRVKLLRYDRQGKEYLSDAEYAKLIESLDKSYYPEHRDYAIINLIMDSGMRLGECTCLRLEDINLQNNSILLRAEITKGRRDRTVYFSPKTESILRRWLSYKDRHVESNYLFPLTHNGLNISVHAFEKNFRNYLKRAGITQNYSPHCLRNNFAKRCLMNGMDIYTLSKILGHSSVIVTEKAYLDLTSEEIGKRYQSFSPVANMQK